MRQARINKQWVDIDKETALPAINRVEVVYAGGAVKKVRASNLRDKPVEKPAEQTPTEEYAEAGTQDIADKPKTGRKRRSRRV